MATWENRALRAEGLLESVEQPTKYMIDSIRSKEAEIESLRSAQHRLVAKTEALERACRCVSPPRAHPFAVAIADVASLPLACCCVVLCPGAGINPYNLSSFDVDTRLVFILVHMSVRDLL